METGETIRDYVLENFIGAGGAGEVWQARHRQIGKQVAIKVIHLNLNQDANLKDRVVQEADAMGRLKHPYIVQLHEFFFLHGRPHLVMDYIEGESLLSRIVKIQRLPLTEVLSISRDILSALNFAHTNGIIHRDVKPANILLGRDGHAYITDFGTALMLGKTRMTKFGRTVGTPEYMSPEQIQGQDQNHLTDVYSFGCVLYEMLTGRPPFGSRDQDGLTEFTIMSHHLNNTPVSLKELNPEVGENIADVIHSALQKMPDLRPGGCAEMSDLLGVIGDRKIKPEVVRESSKPIHKPQEPRVAKIFGIFAALTVGVLIFVWMINQDKQSGFIEKQQSLPSEQQTNEERRKAEEKLKLLENEIAEKNRKSEEEQKRAEAERQAAEELKRKEIESRRKAEEEHKRKEAERKRRLEEERRKNEKIHEFALRGFYKKFPHLKNESPEKTIQHEKWEIYRNCYGVVDYLFFERHPERNEAPLKPNEKNLIDEWMEIQRAVPGCTGTY